MAVIDYDGKIGKALLCLDITNISDPKLIGHLDIELAIKRIVDNKRRLAAVLTWAALISNLCFDTSKFC